jgi:hyaluronidase-like protein HylP
MARYWFGGGPADFAVQVNGDQLYLTAGAALSFYDAADGGSQVTDLLDDAGNAVASGVVIATEEGRIPRFQGPDGVTTLWADGGLGRYILQTTDAAELALDAAGPSLGEIDTDLHVTGGVEADGIVEASGLSVVTATELAAGKAGLDGLGDLLRLVSDLPDSSIELVASGDDDVIVRIDGAVVATFTSAGLDIEKGLTVDSAVRAAFLKTTSTSQHAATVYQAGTSGTGVALNVTSDNPDDSAMYLSGIESGRGTLKIAHRKPGVSDANAAGLSIDLQDGAGNGDSAAQGIFVTATEGATTGNLLTLRNNARDDLVVKGTGRVGVGVATGATPAGVVEVKQNDDTVVGLAMTGRAAGAQMVLLKDSGGNARFEVNNSGNIVARATAFLSTSVQVGTTTADLGGGTGVISIKDRGTAPTSNPTGGLILYSESGQLKVRQSDGTISRLYPYDGAATAWTPTITGGTSGTWVPSSSTVTGRYFRVGRNIRGWCKVSLAGSPSISGSITGTLRISLPVAATATFGSDWQIGEAMFFEGSPAGRWGAFAMTDTTTTAIFVKSADGGVITNVQPSGNVFAAGDEIRFKFAYEAASDA